ncbi:hypothetical protein SmJEL517_g02218 [Synchytrium microbalum]|uniref:Glucosidase 2 subunit beta n=1 Tax=Synchytrium microbalum TaxID=1806994 RepID=A0A507CBD4_9FUNG|nr:uncharacterized protein SmJEL517_g02218 [Synchytrium microbalum]TPX35264.1 hypothetical protein SmJEL517_g02218 [Synchytrium microbalum]
MRYVGFRWVAIVVLLSLYYSEAADVKNPRLRGVPKSKRDLYRQAGPNNSWKCLNGIGIISYDAVNDDYCDCSDGSDEPGTSACEYTFFTCKNHHHRPARIKSSSVNDGVCDPDCCDGSDESTSGVTCPNQCKEAAIEAALAQVAETRELAEGLKIKEREYTRYNQIKLDELRGKLDDEYKKDPVSRPDIEKISDEIDKMEKRGGDEKYGVGSVFEKYQDHWLILDTVEYTYELVVFADLTQIRKDTNSRTKLGTFKSWLTPNSITYDSGDFCNGVARTAKVIFSCGPVETFKDIKEPATCYYEAFVTTPAACEKQAQHEKDEL